jgi:hypothetical protein
MGKRATRTKAQVCAPKRTFFVKFLPSGERLTPNDFRSWINPRMPHYSFMDLVFDCPCSSRMEAAKLIIDHLKDALHHMTSLKGFRGITQDGIVRPTITHPMTFKLIGKPYLWSMYAIAFASDSTVSTRSVGTPKLSNRSVTWGFSQISLLRQSSPPLASLRRRYAIFTVCPK